MTSCIGLSNGYHFVKLMEDDLANSIEYPILYVLCDNEYMIIDYSLDPEWLFYFSTWIKYHYGVVGPMRNDKRNWNEWFLPNMENEHDHFIVSPNCKQCTESSPNQLHGNHSAYYMSALAFGCFSQVRGWPACDFDYDSYECKTCHWDEALTQIHSQKRDDTITWEDAIAQNLKTGVCDFEIRSATQLVAQSYTECASDGNENKNWKPSLGIDGRYCQCYKPFNKKERLSQIVVSKDKIKSKRKQIMSLRHRRDEIKVDEVETQSNVKLYQSDFDEGTYRILQSGTYVIMEDIEFDFNPPPKGHPSPNNNEDLYYWPLRGTENKYPGAHSSRDPFFLGFFAGISVECDNVIIDLNGFEMRMSRPFYYQQPFFSIIELSSQSFLPQQGPGFFGADPHFAKEVEIKNGKIGLSSHHGIHGNNNENVHIHDVHILHFQTHGVQLNGFKGLTMQNIEIGPSTERAYLNGNYGQIRLLLPKMAKIANEHKGEYISFNGREHEKVTMQDLVDKVIKMMDMMLSFVVDGKVNKDDPLWDEAVDAFLNPSGLSFGAVLYGLYLNYPSAGIFGWHVNDAKSYGAKLENVHIHDLRHKGIEVVGILENGRVVCNGFNGPIPAKDVFGSIDKIESFQQKLYAERPNDLEVEYAEYVGSIISDIHIAMYYFGRDDFENWAGIPFYGADDNIVDWSMGKMPNYIGSDAENRAFGFYCNEDAMFHPAKGLLAMKISGVNDVVMSGVTIENVQDETVLGSTLCGEVDEPRHGLYHFAQQIPYQVGFSMNMVMGLTIDFSDVKMENMKISNLYSDTGLVYGLAAWFESDIDVRGQLNIEHLSAGKDNFEYDDLPNKAAEACAIRLFDDDNFPLKVNWNENELRLKQNCVVGVVGCLGDVDFTQFGQMDDVQCRNKHLLFEAAPTNIDELEKSETSLIPKPRPEDEHQSKLVGINIANSIVWPGNTFMYLMTFAIDAFIGSLLIIFVMFYCNHKRNNKSKQDEAELNPTWSQY